MRKRHIPYPGARLDAPPATIVERCAAYLSRAGDDEFISHITALRLYDLPVPERHRADPVIHVSVAAPSFPPQVRGVTAHRLSVQPELAVIDGVRRVRHVEAWVQVGSMLSVRELVVLGDALVRRRHSMTTLSELGRVVRLTSGLRGARKLREAVSLVRRGTDSVAETRLRLLLIGAGLPEPIVGHVVAHNGSFVGVPDLAYLVQRIAIEYEGDVHRLDLATFRNDIERRERFEDAGWRVIRVTADHLVYPAARAARIAAALRSRS